ncbi:MAG: glycosyltransferase N-terminal domain-containing protein [Bacteroidota bacterium]
MLLLYNLAIRLYLLAIRLAAPFVPKAARWRSGRRDLFEQLEAALPAARPLLWMHCASLGEFEQGRPLLGALRQQYPQHFLLLTFFSPSGYDIRQHYDQVDYVSYLPADTPARARRFVRLTQPQLAIFVKYEFWYHHLHALHQAGVPTLLVSALFRPQQLFFRPWGHFLRPILHWYHHLFVQDEASKQLLARWGITTVSRSGDTRVDRVAQLAGQALADPLVEAFAGSQPVLIAGSSWPADEALLCRYINEAAPSDWKLIIAPHDIAPSHVQQIEGRLRVSYCRYSAAQREDAAAARVLIVDNIGKLSSIYRYGHIAYIGGGFGSGIHNTLEPAAYGLPVIFGPRYSKFTEAVQLIAEKGAFSIKDYAQLRAVLERLREVEEHQRAAKASKTYIRQQLGATDAVINSIKKMLKS